MPHTSARDVPEGGFGCTGWARDEKWDESLEASDERRLVKPIIEIL